MKSRIFKIVNIALVILLVIGLAAAVFNTDTVKPDNPIADTGTVLTPTSLGGGGLGTQDENESEENTDDSTDDSEDQDEQNDTSEENNDDQTDDSQQDTDQTGALSADATSTNGTSGSGAGSGTGNSSGGSGQINSSEGTDGESEGDKTQKEDTDQSEPKIATNLGQFKLVSQQDYPDGVLDFYAYPEGKGELSLKVQVKESGSSSNGKVLKSADDKNYSFEMELGKKYQFTLYLYQNEKRISYAVYYVTYQAQRADESNPVVGQGVDISTNIDYMEDGAQIEGENLVFIVTARSKPDGNVVTADKIEVKLNGVVVQKDTGNSSPEYNLYFSPPNRGDYKEYKIEVTAWYGNDSSYWKKTLVYHASAEGDTVGSATIILDATTVGLGVIDEAEYELVKGDTAADMLLAFLDEYGYDASYAGTSKQNFYLRRLTRGGLCSAASVPNDLWELILRDGINLSNASDEDSLGEHDYTMGAGWMYSINGTYPGRALSAYELKDGDVLRMCFTLSYGKDVAGYDTSGTGYGQLTSYCGIWLDGGYQSLGHDYTETSRVEPTADTDGYIEYTCSNCGSTYRDVLPATGGSTDSSTEPPDTSDTSGTSEETENEDANLNE